MLWTVGSTLSVDAVGLICYAALLALRRILSFFAKKWQVEITYMFQSRNSLDEICCESSMRPVSCIAS